MITQELDPASSNMGVAHAYVADVTPPADRADPPHGAAAALTAATMTVSVLRMKRPVAEVEG